MSRTPEQIKIGEDQKKQAELYALWWMHAATNGHAATRTIHKGASDGPKMTADELRDEAMQTAMRHIQRFSELAGI